MERIALVEMGVGTRSDVDPSELILTVQSLDQEESPTWTHRSRRIDHIVRQIVIGEGLGMQANDRKLSWKTGEGNYHISCPNRQPKPAPASA